MTLRHRFTLRSASAGAVLGLAASTAVVLGTAGTASATPIDFSCDVPILGPNTFSVDVSTNAPATAPAGTSVSPTVTSVMTVPAGLADTMRGLLGTDQIGGTVQATNLVNGVAVPMTITIPTTTVPASGPIALTGTGVMPAFTAGPEGTTHEITAGAQKVGMVLLNDGTPSPFDIPCTPAAGQNTLIGSVKATAAPASTTTLKAKYVKKSRKATVTASVSAPGANPSGTITFTLKKGKKVKTKTVAITGGTAKATFKKLPKGKYKVTASYTGSVGSSSATTKLKVR
ncbi:MULTISPECIES: DUF6801 domain-containing protein [unclassified Nocardioides]|uniref:DUF6801 domain-containing protein n=1 Tax=unclassified Nocardioides TaxID=2615069 RepID=UPI00114FBCA2|nr:MULTISPECIES: DUF6801 domain-containing protein [unclassified Nocardioides]TQK70697.1 Ig-like domain-containing protein [Nocardioides sp. SLBN-35]WGX99916.1 Ig-like domain repeat protein [Nocardioides sp. QY071]